MCAFVKLLCFYLYFVVQMSQNVLFVNSYESICGENVGCFSTDVFECIHIKVQNVGYMNCFVFCTVYRLHYGWSDSFKTASFFGAYVTF